MHVPLHVEIDMYDGNRSHNHEGLIELYKMVLVIPKNDASITKTLISREFNGTARVVRVREGGFELHADLRDRFLVAVFLHLYRRMRKNSGTGYDWWTTSVGHSLAGIVGETEVAEIIAALSEHVTPDSHISEHSVTRLSRW